MIRTGLTLKLSRAAAVVLGACLTFAGAASCRDVVSGSSLDATQALCSTLQDCYGPERYSCSELDLAVTNANDDDVSGFLTTFVADDCSAQCSAALNCLDNAVFCVGGAEPCASTENCCDWSRGLTSCKAGSCCKNNGVRCDDSSDCCENNCIGGFCGGYECFENDRPCTFDAECCTSNCTKEGRCDTSSCTQLGQPCISQSECCQLEDPDENGDLPIAICIAKAGASQSTCELLTEEECADTLQPCALEPTPGSTPCCGGLECRPSLDSQFAFCVEPGGCNPNGFDCAVDADCCSPSAVCVLGPNVSICVDNLGCEKAGTDCIDNGECCSGECSASGFCQQGSGVVCENVERTCHSPLQPGPVITEDETCSYLPDECVSAVLEADVFCRCNSWDTTCVNRYDNCSNP